MQRKGDLQNTMKTTLTQIEQLLACCLNQFPINQEDKLAMLCFLREEEDQLLMIHFLKTHPTAQEDDIMNEYGKILARRKKLTDAGTRKGTEYKKKEDLQNTTKTTLTKVQKMLLYGLKMFKVTEEDAVAIVAFLTEDEQILLIHYMKTHPNATAQEVVNESGRILELRKKLTN